MTAHDIVDELRGFAGDTQSARASLMRDAADEIERLRGETEWEYAVEHGRLVLPEHFDDPSEAERHAHAWSTSATILRRRKAGPWGPAEGDDEIIDTTPKPRVPEDARFITWRDGLGLRRYAEKQRDGSWRDDAGNRGAPWKSDSVTPNTVFTVLEERKP